MHPHEFFSKKLVRIPLFCLISWMHSLLFLGNHFVPSCLFVQDDEVIDRKFGQVDRVAPLIKDR